MFKMYARLGLTEAAGDAGGGGLRGRQRLPNHPRDAGRPLCLGPRQVCWAGPVHRSSGAPSAPRWGRGALGVGGKQVQPTRAPELRRSLAGLCGARAFWKGVGASAQSLAGLTKCGDRAGAEAKKEPLTRLWSQEQNAGFLGARGQDGGGQGG